MVTQKPSQFISKWGIPQRNIEQSLLTTNIQDSFEDLIETKLEEDEKEETIFVSEHFTQFDLRAHSLNFRKVEKFERGEKKILKIFSTSAGYTFVSTIEGLFHFKSWILALSTLCGIYPVGFILIQIQSSVNFRTLCYVFGLTLMIAKLFTWQLYLHAL